jgi:hypothetical protein
MIKKSLILIASLVTISWSAGAGFRVSAVDAEIMGAGPGAGVHAIWDVTRVLQFYPSIDIWHSSVVSGGYHTYYDNGTWVDFTGDQTHKVTEISFNVDFRLVFLNAMIRPFIGLGGAPVFTADSWQPGLSGYMWGPGFNLFAGMDFRYLENYQFFIEIRGKMGSEYGVAKLSVGTTFGKLK